MYIAMNNFRVDPSRSADFEKAWRERESYLAGVPGFREFHLLKGPVDEQGGQLYASHTVWADEQSFTAWTKSEAFHKAHSQGRTTASFMLGPPRFIGWQVVL
jgi:heme-degrading monooxygenase HmoA